MAQREVPELPEWAKKDEPPAHLLYNHAMPAASPGPDAGQHGSSESAARPYGGQAVGPDANRLEPLQSPSTSYDRSQPSNTAIAALSQSPPKDQPR